MKDKILLSQNLKDHVKDNVLYWDGFYFDISSTNMPFLI